MYGTYTCGYCKLQKDLFGDAFQYVTYVECHSQGPNGQPELCRSRGIEAVPAWEIKGRLYPGYKPLEALAELSGYKE